LVGSRPAHDDGYDVVVNNNDDDNNAADDKDDDGDCDSYDNGCYEYECEIIFINSRNIIHILIFIHRN